MEAAIGVVLLIITLVGIILLANQIDNWTKRERGIPRKRRKRIGKRKDGGKHQG